MPEIRVFYTHIEVFPYCEGDAPNIEKMLSKYDTICHKYINVGYYIQDDILYLPRGMNLSLLQSVFNSVPTIMSKYSSYDLIENINIKSEARDQTQSDSIDFLTSKGNFTRGVYSSQLGLNIDTGKGKTYCMISAIVKMRMKAIIITHKTRIKEQWIEEFLDKTDIKEDKIINISSSEVIKKIMNNKLSGDIYVVNHQTLHSYASIGDEVYDWNKVQEFFIKIKIGIKVIDEAHKFFRNSLMLDFFSNVKRSYYLTATFKRSDPKEYKIFNMSYSSVYRFGEETFNYEENRKHIIMVVIYYYTNPSELQKRMLSTAHGFSSYKFIDYELNNEENTLVRVVKYVLDKVENLEGRILINSPKTESVDKLAEIAKRFTNKTVGTVHSKNSKKDNDENIKCEIVSSTNKSIGEGDNLKGLRVIINTEPIGSQTLADQLRGRLREYNQTDDTFLFYLVDAGVPECCEFLKRVMPVMRKKCKEIKTITLNI